MSEENFPFKGVEHRVLEGKKGVREAYDCMSITYDHSEYLRWTRRMEQAEESAIRRWLLKLPGPVLDVGCGTGRYAVRVAGMDSEVLALDASSKMLEKAMEKAQRHNAVEKIGPVVGDGEHLPFRGQSFNGLICTLALDHFQDCELSAREFARVLRKDGLCILTGLNSYTLNEFKRRHKLPCDKVPFSNESLPPVLIYEVGHSADEVKGIFEKYGFTVIDVEGCCYWHVLPIALISLYRTELDSSPLFSLLFSLLSRILSILNVFRLFLKYAEIHGSLLRKN
jgi:ubiquinone/menaquinone biosynthesis C-methylase UbiE